MDSEDLPAAGLGGGAGRGAAGRGGRACRRARRLRAAGRQLRHVPCNG